MRFLRNIYDSSLRLTGWVEEVLRFYDLSSQLKHEMKEVEIQSMVGQVVEFLKECGREKQIEILFQSCPPVPPIQGN